MSATQSKLKQNLACNSIEASLREIGEWYRYEAKLGLLSSQVVQHALPHRFKTLPATVSEAMAASAFRKTSKCSGQSDNISTKSASYSILSPLDAIARPTYYTLGERIPFSCCHDGCLTFEP